jgi:hypothetical protein
MGGLRANVRPARMIVFREWLRVFPRDLTYGGGAKQFMAECLVNSLHIIIWTQLIAAN